MSFENQLQKQFDSLSISVIDQPKYKYHLHADYIELVCLVSNDWVSKSDIIDRLTDNGMTFSLKDEKLDGESGSVDAEIEDDKEGWINDLFSKLDERVVLYKEAYPFEVKGNRIKRKDDLNPKREIYIYLLIAATLMFFDKLESTITSDFEKFSEEVLKNYLPPSAVVKSFGKHSNFRGTAIKKIRDLAELLNLETDEYEIGTISPRNTQEEGLDIIGWIPFKDSNPNTLIFMVQCACGKKWFGKRFETSRYENFYNFYKHPPIHSLFIPYALSNTDGRFDQSKDIVIPTVVFDRLRLIDNSESIEFDDSYLSKQIVQKCIQYQEDIV